MRVIFVMSELEILRFNNMGGIGKSKKPCHNGKSSKRIHGSFSILFRIVKLLHLTIFSFLLFFSNLGLKMS
jgi:hypothetical protein